MTIKKLTVIAAAGAVLLAGAIGLSMSLTSQNEMEMEVPETPVAQETEDGSKTLGDMENIPLYYDETEKLLLPLRNVMEGLGGSVKWDKETRLTEVSYRGRTLSLAAGEEQALLNGYEVTLPEAAEIINGCLYADEALISAYYTGDVDFNIDTRQVTLQTKDNAVPVVAKNVISGEKDGRSYKIQVPVIVGLNDSNYEKNLNKELAAEMQEMADAFLAEDAEELLEMRVYTMLCTKDFISLDLKGEKDDIYIRTAKNIDLMAQKMVTLEDMVTPASLKKAEELAGEGWTADQFYLIEDGGIYLIKEDKDASSGHYFYPAEDYFQWKSAYEGLFQKK